MTLRSLAFATALALSLPLAGCMTSGVKFTMAEVESLQPGVTTKDEAIALLGKPTSRSTMADGTELLQWMYTEVVYIAGDSRHVAILFGRDGRMLRITHQYDSKF